MRAAALLVAAVLAAAPLAHAQVADNAAKTFRDCRDCPKMVIVRAGEFLMGSPSSEKGRDADESPQHRVKLARPFGVARYKVTRAQYAVFVEATARPDGEGCWVWNSRKRRWQQEQDKNWRNPGFAQSDEHPVVCVSWEDAQAYARWISQRTGEAYRLLTEAEREYATRAGSTASRPWGDDPGEACLHANVADRTAERQLLGLPGWVECSDGYVYTSPVGVFQPNAFGLNDMIGNAWEWVEDCYHDSFNGAPRDGSAWTSGECSERVLRGGSWDNVPRSTRSAYRHSSAASTRTSALGFRVARTQP